MKTLVLMFFLILTGVDSSEINSSIEMNTTIEHIDKENLFSALKEKNLKYCSLIANKDRKIECFGIIKRNSGYCDMITDKDLKNKCLSVALSDDSLCNKIKSTTIKHECKVLDR
jgi:hypothetical protein